MSGMSMEQQGAGGEQGPGGGKAVTEGRVWRSLQGHWLCRMESFSGTVDLQINIRGSRRTLSRETS